MIGRKEKKKEEKETSWAKGKILPPPRPPSSRLSLKDAMDLAKQLGHDGFEQHEQLHPKKNFKGGDSVWIGSPGDPWQEAKIVKIYEEGSSTWIEDDGTEKEHWGGYTTFPTFEGGKIFYFRETAPNEIFFLMSRYLEKKKSEFTCCCQKGKAEVLVKLLGQDFSLLNAILDEDGRTAIMLASLHQHKHVVEVLLSVGAEIDLRDKDGRTALMLASSYGHNEVVEILVSNGANISLQDNDGKTALHFWNSRDPSGKSLKNEPKEGCSWPMQVVGKSSLGVDGLYDVIPGTSLGCPIFKKREEDFFLYCWGHDRRWVISKTLEMNDNLSDFIFLQSEDTNKELPSYVSKWKGLQHGQWVINDQISIRDYTSICQVFDSSNENNSVFEKGKYEDTSHLSTVIGVCSGLASVVKSLSRVIYFAEDAIEIIDVVAEMGHKVVMNKQKCVLLTKRLQSVAPILNQLTDNLQDRLRELLMSCPLPVPKELERFKGDMIAILPGLEALTQRIEECKQVILKWGEEGENYGGGRKRAKNVSTGLCQGSIKIEFMECGLRFEKALQNLNIALRERNFVKLLSCVEEKEWKKQMEEKDEEDRKEFKSCVSALIMESRTVKRGLENPL